IPGSVFLKEQFIVFDMCHHRMRKPEHHRHGGTQIRSDPPGIKAKELEGFEEYMINQNHSKARLFQMKKENNT
ncbi:hypothetical protein NQU36_26880, partial [Escherichia coli]|uniref:hypothetical protein n=1 Tax=Escherichia coli TaxID=562 RepID=UPI002118371B